MSTPLDLLAISLNTGNGDTGPTWAVVLFVAVWVVLASFIVYGKLRKRKQGEGRSRTASTTRA